MVLTYGINVIDLLPIFLMSGDHKENWFIITFLQAFPHYDYSDQQNAETTVNST